MSSVKSLDVTESVIRAIVGQIGVKGLAVALNNVFAHGEIIKEVYGFCPQSDLDTIYESIEKMCEVGESLEG